jgi:tRNA dimethylallyltransferase
MDTSKDNSDRLIVICGPTASGKTSLAVKLAGALNGEIISADSRQVYRGMDIGTGKDLSEYTSGSTTVPCHCIDIAHPADPYTLFEYIEDCHSAIRQIFSRGRTPIITGGAGLYIEAILKGYRLPAVPENSELRKSMGGLDNQELSVMLKELDPEIYSETDLSAKKRIIRAIEVALYKKEKPLRYAGENPPDFSPVVIAVNRPRQQIISMISRRLKQRLNAGMVDEVKGLLDSGIHPERLIFFGMEYKFITLHLQGKLAYDEMVSMLETEIYRLAKRQMTWFRGMEKRGIKVHWITGNLEDEAKKVLRQYNF